MEHTNEKKKGKMGKLLLGGVAFLIAVAFLQTGFRRSAASGGQKGGSAARVAIDVNPGGAKAIDLGSRGNLAVAVLGAKGFDVASIDVSSVGFAGALTTKTDDSVRPGALNDKGGREGAINFNVAFRDVNKDGIVDLVASFPIPFLTQLSAGTTSAVLRGQLLDGSFIEGSQTVEATGESPIKSGGGANIPEGGPPQFCNSAPIVFPADPPGSGDAAPFPSTILVAGAPASITGVTVTLNDVSHTFPDDLEIILVSPTNRVLILDNGGWDATDAIAQDITFSQLAANYVPESAPMVTGTFKPASYFAQTSFGAPAPPLSPAAPYAHTFNAFNGSDANGTWSLFARDVVGGDTGVIAGGWCISFPTISPACSNQLFLGSLAAGDTTQTGRLLRDGVAGLCDIPKPCPGLGAATGSRFYDTYTITNNSGASACVTVSATGTCGGANNGSLFLAVYQPSFNPASLCTNYVSDAGTVLPTGFATSETQTLAFGLAAGQSVVLVVHEINPAGGCTSYGVLVEGLICAPAGACTITCPANVTQSNDPNQCGAVVTYPAPTTTGTCGTVTCSPASGSFFPVGTTTVTCTSSAGPTCTFTVTVNDTQPPTITCPPNVTVVTALTCPATPSSVVEFPPPTASDNCPGVTVQCVPPSGSVFPVGTTTVTCTATDASGNTATCTFTLTAFDVCLQDDSNPTTKLLINSFTGDYRFFCQGTVFTGRGKVSGLGCDKQLLHNPADRKVRANWTIPAKKGNASIQSPPGTVRCTLGDSNMTNNDCATGLGPPK